MTNFWTAYTGILIGLVLIFSGIMLSFCGGIALDAMSDAFIGAGLDQGVGTAYDSSGEINLLSNLFYVLCYALPLLGIGTAYHDHAADAVTTSSSKYISTKRIIEPDLGDPDSNRRVLADAI